ncbi:MAG: sodium:proton antiporter [Planctomycetes bacterium]|nr:sodium:proton antiporter [Planctomycetota bacterium]
MKKSLFLLALFPFLFAFGGDGKYWEGLATPMLVLWCMPFVLLLLSIAVLPLVAEHWWHKNSNKAIISCVFGVPIALLMFNMDTHILLHTFIDYLAFIALLTALFIISGGIVIKGSYTGKPLTNVVIFLIGAVLANFIGTTGASMLLIRPLLQANKIRKFKVHSVIFFIFIVSNCGGLLTPLGDPPLFLGFLQGVPFEWTLQLWKEWLFVIGVVSVIYLVLDNIMYKKESQEIRNQLSAAGDVPFAIKGAYNFMFLVIIILVILASAMVIEPVLNEYFHHDHAMAGIASKIIQTVLMLATAVVAYKLTPSKLRQYNEFSFYPIAEVAILFAGIFAAMIPALIILEKRGSEFGVTKPWQFFWMTGMLSSFLDNAPTYLTYTSLAKGLLGADTMTVLIQKGPVFLVAISCGAVFMGANTYIGNAPNFMVKSIAEQQGVKMPSFFGYMMWSLAILIPVFVLVTFVFFI